MIKRDYCVIMAGGVGSRFWPISRNYKPKQFLDFLGTGRSLLQQTYDRFLGIIPNENIYIVTNIEYVDLVKEQLPDILPENVLGEPMRRNTAPCILYAALKIKLTDPLAQVVVTPADHLILDIESFRKDIIKGLSFVSTNDVLLTLGIVPTRPATSYGYIQVSSLKDKEKIIPAKAFTEKPQLELAKLFVQSGEFLWNSGIFIWKNEVILDAINTFLPELFNIFIENIDYLNTDREKEMINRVYSDAKGISIDYGVMEKAKNVFVIKSDFGWSDLGTWNSLYVINEKNQDENVLNAKNIIISKSSRNYIHSEVTEKVYLIQDVKDLIIVDTEDALLICKRENEQEIADLFNEAKLKFGESIK